MSSSVYDTYHPPTSHAFPHGDSWRPTEPPPPYEVGTPTPLFNTLSPQRLQRPLQHSARRRSPSPTRQYRSYDSHYPIENNYRPNYRPDDTEYFSRSPSPDRYAARIPVLDPWRPGTPTFYGPISPVSRQRGENMLATRMFEPSASWKQTQTDRPPRMDLCV